MTACRDSGFKVYPTRYAISEDNREDSRCQLIHCTFCDYRVCCPQTPAGTSDFAGERKSVDSNCFQITENPACGLSNLWPECEQPPQKEDRHRTEDPYKKDRSVRMNQVNIASCCPLESIPEIREDIVAKRRNDIPVQDTPIGPTKKRDWRDPWAGHESDIEGNRNDVTKCKKYSAFNKTCDLPIANTSKDINQLSGRSNDTKIVNNHSNIKDNAFISAHVSSHLRGNDVKQGESIFHLKSNTKQDSGGVGVRKPAANAREKSTLANSRQLRTSDVLGHDKLTEITSVKTEESVHEWLMRISDWVDNNTSTKEGEYSDDDLPEIEEDWTSVSEMESNLADPRRQNSEDQSKIDVIRNIFDDLLSESSLLNTLSKSTKESPANIPMVVMQCSRLHSHINSKPPFQQTSLPMGTLVTALYQESGWLYVQTPHGVEGFITPGNCVPIGTVQGSNKPKRPWEPCDFPIEIRINNTWDFGQLHETFVQAKLPANSGKRSGPFVSMFKMKANIYNDRYYNTTFKLRDSIKTAKTVTDILRSSPEIKVNEQ